MELIFEIVMGVMFDIAMHLLVLRLAKQEEQDRGKCRFISITFGIGFLLGIIAKCLAGGDYIVLALFALGFMLSYTAFLFTFPEKEKHNESR